MHDSKTCIMNHNFLLVSQNLSGLHKDEIWFQLQVIYVSFQPLFLFLQGHKLDINKTIH